MNLTESIAIGLVIGFFFYERFGLSPGGFVVPGYIALFWDRPFMILATLLVGFLAYGTVHLLSKGTILYGRRRFILTVLTGFAFQWLFHLAVIQYHLTNIEIDPIGYIIPGLIGNEMERQRIWPTIFSLVIVSVLVRLISALWGYIRIG